MDLPGVGRLHPPPTSGHPPEASEAARDRAWPGQSTLAQRLLRRAGAVQSGTSPRRGPSTLSEVTPSAGEPYAGDPPVRFGGGRGPNPIGPPYPYHDVVKGLTTSGGWDLCSDPGGLPRFRRR